MVSAKPTDKLFVCPECQKGNFKSLGAVKVHFEAKGHPLRCTPCDRSFDAIMGLLLHSLKHEATAPSTSMKTEPASKCNQKKEKSNDHPKPVDVIPKRTHLKDQTKHETKDLKKEKFKDHTKPMDSISKHSSNQLQQPQKQEKSPSHPDSKLSKLKLKHTQKFVKAQDQSHLMSVKPMETMSNSTSAQSQPPQKNGKVKAKDRSKPMPVQPAEILNRTRRQSPLRSVFSGHTKSGDVHSFSFGDTLLDTPEREASQPSNQTSTQNQNENYHVVLEPLEQNLIFRYLSARCHSDTRLAKFGYTFQPNINESHKRPSKQCPIKRGLFREVPRFSTDNFPKRRAIVIDCEMVQVEEGRRELAFLTAIDFLTGEVLIDNYVQPKTKVVNWDSRFSGVTPSAMNKAVKKGTALKGWEGARERLWQFMNSETVLIGHSLNNDLDVLGVIHWNIVDSAIFTSEAVFLHLHSNQQLTRTWSLKTLTSELVNYDIQVGQRGHSALEDAHATRDVVVWCLRYPELLKVWADRAREEEAVRALERDLKKTTDKEQLEDKRRLEMESRFQALSQGLGGMVVTEPDSADDLDGPLHEVSTGYVAVQSVEYF
jgi:DNA polymerase III epsilon subunit-like protein